VAGTRRGFRSSTPRGTSPIRSYGELESPPDVWAWRRGETCVVAVNLGAGEARLEIEGRVELSTDREG